MTAPWRGAATGDDANAGGDDDEDDETGKGIIKRHITLFLSEESLRKKRALTRGTASLKQCEGLRVISSSWSLSLPERPGKHYTGSNRGQTCRG